MTELRFDDRVAVITGAGRGLGHGYARLLAARGAKVVVNDTGAAVSGDGLDKGPADEVVREIRAAGGEAVASTDTVATPAGGKAIIETALDHYKRIDILIHNAGNVRRGSLTEMTQEDFDAVLDVHLRGGFHVVRPSFPIMSKAGYGRIVLTSSIVGTYGNLRSVNYAVCKSGLLGMLNVCALEGDAVGIKCNAILPGSVTRLAEGASQIDTSKYPPTMRPEMIAPVVAWLSHESCSVNGETLISIGGRVARGFFAETRGVFRESWTIEQVAEQMGAIRDTKQQVTFPPLTAFTDHIKYSLEMGTKH